MSLLYEFPANALSQFNQKEGSEEKLSILLVILFYLTHN